MPKRNNLKFYIVGLLCLAICGVLSVYYFGPSLLEDRPQTSHELPVSTTEQDQQDSDSADGSAQSGTLVAPGGDTNTNPHTAPPTEDTKTVEENAGFIGTLMAYFPAEKASLTNPVVMGLVGGGGILAIIVYLLKNNGGDKGNNQHTKIEVGDKKGDAHANLLSKLDLKKGVYPQWGIKGWKSTRASKIKENELENYLNGEGKNKPFAILDVDEALLLLLTDQDDLAIEKVINLVLISALKMAGITDVVLFTKMSARKMLKEKEKKKKTEKTRWEVITALERNDIKVWGVITSADPAYENGLGAPYRDFMAGVLLEKVNKQINVLVNSHSPNLLNDQHFKKLLSEENAYDFLVNNDTGKEKNKKSMFNYFMKCCPDFQNLLLFFDDDDLLDTFFLTPRTVYQQGDQLPQHTWKLVNKVEEDLNKVGNSILCTAADEYHKRGEKAKFTLVCIQVPANWKGYGNIINQNNVASSIGPQTASYYRAILAGYSALKPKKQPLIYVRPGLAVTEAYLNKELAKKGNSDTIPYTWGVWDYNKQYSLIGNKSIKFVTLIEKPKKK